MENKIKEKTEKLQEVINQINAARNQISLLEKEGLMIKGELRLLDELKLKETEQKKPRRKK
jgi:hypothetical protein